MLCIALGRTPTLTGIENILVAGFSDITDKHWAYPYAIEAAYEHEVAFNDDGSELWLSTKDENFYLKKASDEFIASLDAEFEARKKEILNTKSEWTVVPGGKVWYVSNAGNDSNDGLSEKTPLATMRKVMELQNDKVINSGDVVLLNRGDEWHVKFYCKNGVTYSAYGEGAKPRVLGSIEADKPEQWVAAGYPNLYKFAEPVLMSQDVGQIVFNDGEAYGMRVIKSLKEDITLAAGQDNLVSNGIDYWYFPPQPFTGGKDLSHHLQFYHDWNESTLYLYCEGGNPGDLFDSIEIATKDNTVYATSNVTIDNWNVRYTGSHGIGCASATNLTVRNCEVGWIGGSFQQPGIDDARFGNAVEIFGEGVNYYVYNNYMHNCFDCGPTVQWQGTIKEGERCVSENIEIRDNVLWEADLEVWHAPHHPITPTRYAALINCKLTNNLVKHSGYGWSGYNHQKSEYIAFYGGAEAFTAEVIDCEISGNKFWDMRKQLLRCASNSMKDDLGFMWYDNIIVHEYGKNFGWFAKDLNNAAGAATPYLYTNAVVKQMLGTKAMGFNDLYYTLAPGQADPAN